MRPADDLAERTRSWFWYWIVRNQSGQSNDALDAHFLDTGTEGGRKRHFERIEQTASSPASVALKDGKTLLELVDESGMLEAKAVYESRLWEFLTVRDAPAQVYSDYIAEYIASRDWHRIDTQSAGLYLTFLGQQEPAIQADVGTTYSAMLHKLVNEANFDSITVLVALFREALAGMLLRQAIAIDHALSTSIFMVCERNSIPRTPSRLLKKLVNDRVLANRWFSHEDWLRHSNVTRKPKPSTRERMHEFQAWVKWYIEESHQVDKNPYGMFPIVPRSERIEWIEENRSELQSINKKMAELNNEHWMFNDSLIPSFRQRAEHSQLLAAVLPKIYAAPHTAAKRFYESEPPLVMGNLPAAF